jgi:Ser/Thr protein kinase RdoA (MazF antagonist)
VNTFPQPPHSLADGPSAAEAYVRQSLHALDLDPDSLVTVAYLDAGIMNYVYRVEAAGRTFYLKQALPQVKEHHRLGPDLAGVSPARIRAEARALQLLGMEVAAEHRAAFPAPLWHDSENNVLWTEEIAPGARSLQQALQQGECCPVVARHAGRLLGAVHGIRTGHVAPLWPSPEEDLANWLRFLRMRTTGILERAGLSGDTIREVEALFAEARQAERPGMLSHLDAAPKNVLVNPDGTAALLDFELGAAISDPAYDPAFLIGHYLLMGENRPEMRAAAREAARAVVDGYRETGPDADSGWHQRLARYAGLVLIYRLCGSSPAPYLDPARYADIRKAGLELFSARELPLG